MCILQSLCVQYDLYGLDSDVREVGAHPVAKYKKLDCHVANYKKLDCHVAKDINIMSFSKLASLG